MADRVFFVSVSPADFMAGPIVPSQMINDLRVIAETPLDQLQTVSAALHQIEGFISEERLTELVLEHINDEQQSAAVVSVIQNVRPQGVDHVLETIESWRAASPENADRLGDEMVAAVRDKLPQLIRAYDSIERSRKADRLRSMTGNVVQGIEVLCDARPVYNEPRNRIEGLIPTISLKLVYERQNDQTEVLEVMLSPETLKELIEKSQKADDKLRVLRESIVQWIPNGLAEE